MRPLRDFEAYWSAACESSGGAVDTSQGIRLRSPGGGPPVNCILNADGLDLDDELPKWKAQGAPFGLTSTDSVSAAAALRHGMVKANPLVMVEGTTMDLGQPRHRMTADVEAFIDILMLTHEIPPFVRDSFAASMRELATRDTHHLFVADDDGPAGCAILFTGAGHAGLYGFGVLQDKRRGGVATSLAQACMQAALAADLERFVAVTTPDGLALSKQLFGLTPGATIQQFHWFPGGPRPG